MDEIRKYRTAFCLWNSLSLTISGRENNFVGFDRESADSKRVVVSYKQKCARSEYWLIARSTLAQGSCCFI